MIRSCVPRPSQSLPLLAWQELQDLERLHKQFDGLRQRAAALPPYAHRRLELEVRMKDLTTRMLASEKTLQALIGGGR